MSATLAHDPLQAKIQIIRELARERDCSFFLPNTLDQAEHEINRLVATRVPRVYYGPAKPNLVTLCKTIAREVRVNYHHPYTNAEAVAQIKALKSMKKRTAAEIATRHHRPIYGTSGIYDTAGYGTEAYRDRGFSMATASPADMAKVAKLARTRGEAAPDPLTTTDEAQAEIVRLTDTPIRPQPVRRATPRARRYMTDLAIKAGEDVPNSVTSREVSAHIDRLLLKLGKASTPAKG